MKKENLMKILTLLLSIITALQEYYNNHCIKMHGRIKAFQEFISNRRMKVSSNIKALKNSFDNHRIKTRGKIKAFRNFISTQRVRASSNIKALRDAFDNHRVKVHGIIQVWQKSMRDHYIKALYNIKALRRLIKNNCNRAWEALVDFWYSIEDYCACAKKEEKTMTPEEMETFTTISFYTFTLMLIAFVIALPIMIYRGYTFTVIGITLLTIGFALPAAILVVLRKYYWIISYDVSQFFQMYSLLLIGKKETDKKVCSMQLKLFNPLKKTSIIIVICYVLMNWANSNSHDFLSMFLKLLLSGISWTGITVMTADGLYMNFSAIWKIATACLQTAHSKPKRVRKFCIEDIWILQKHGFIWKRKYVPKRLTVQNTSTRENIFSLKILVQELRASDLTARFKSV